MFRLMELLNAQARHNEQDQENVISKGELCKDDKKEIKCHDDTDSVVRGGPMRGLKSFRGSLHWDSDGEDSECPSTNDEEDDEDEESNDDDANCWDDSMMQEFGQQVTTVFTHCVSLMTSGEQKWEEQTAHNLCFSPIDKRTILFGIPVQNVERTEWSTALSIVWSSTSHISGDREESGHGVLTVPTSWTTWSSPTQNVNCPHGTMMLW